MVANDRGEFVCVCVGDLTSLSILYFEIPSFQLEPEVEDERQFYFYAYVVGISKCFVLPPKVKTSKADNDFGEERDTPLFLL